MSTTVGPAAPIETSGRLSFVFSYHGIAGLQIVGYRWVPPHQPSIPSPYVVASPPPLERAADVRLQAVPGNRLLVSAVVDRLPLVQGIPGDGLVRPT